MAERMGVHIIIPVYNAIKELKQCMESLIRHTDLSRDTIVLIEDKSTDKDVLPYLRSQTGPGVILLENEKNLGFSGCVNRGIMYSQQDIILLNSDTIVTSGWVDKIVRCAYSDPAIGTVTPFSNNATLCSTPNFCEDNVVPNNLSIDEYAKTIERCSLREYPKITTAVGFCMFIKREVVDVVGLFDAQTFQRGYGEENDFCFRAEQMGYRQVLCDDTYIYHSGTGSFLSEEKKRLIRDHERILEKRYPIQVQKNAEYVRDNPHQYLRDNIAIYTKLANGKKNVLYLLHADFRPDVKDNIGGTQFHVKDLMMGLRGKYNIFIAARDGEYLRLTAYLEEDQLSFKFFVGPKSEFQQFYAASYTRLYENILRAFRIDLVHVHHVQTLSLDIFKTTKQLGLPLVATMHDFYYICPTVKLLKDGESYCGGDSPDCTECLKRQKGFCDQIDYLPYWRECCRKALGLCDVMIFPSQAAKEIYARKYPQFKEKMHVITHGMDVFECRDMTETAVEIDHLEYRIESAFENNCSIRGWAFLRNYESTETDIFLQVEDSKGRQGLYKALREMRPDVAEVTKNVAYLNSGFTANISDSYFETGELTVRPLLCNGGARYFGKAIQVGGYKKKEKTRNRIAFVGGLNKAKGSQFAYQMIKQAGDNYDWYIFGGIGDPELFALESKHLEKMDWYQRERLGDILRENQIDLVCIMPIWPETFCYTLSETVLAGIPVLATDIGAVGERIRAGRFGWLINPGDTPKQALKQIDAIFSNRGEYAEVSQRAKQFEHKTISDMDSEYDALYQKMIMPATVRPEGDWNRAAIFSAYSERAMLQAEGGTAGMALCQRITDLESTLYGITSSVEYKMLRFISQHNFPLKRQIKKLLLFCYGIYKKCVSQVGG